MDRREFLTGTMGSLVLGARSADLFAQRGTAPAAAGWDNGQLRHLVPTVSDSQMLIKASFVRPLTAAPSLRVGSTTIRGQMSDTAGDIWQFRAVDLRPGQSYRLSLAASNGQALCEPWQLSTFPAADATPDRFRVLFFTCAGGPDSPNLTSGNLPIAIRNRLLRRGLSFQPQAAVANGDHVYWDLHSPRVPRDRRNNTRLESFNRSALVFGTTNETVLKLAAGPQIVPLYGTDFRSTPLFFLQDDHDYFDNDEGTDEIVDVSAAVVSARARPGDAADVLPGISAACHASERAALGIDGRSQKRRVRELGHAALRQAGRSTALRRQAHDDARRRRGVPRAVGRAVAPRTDSVERRDASGPCAVESAGMDRRQMDGVVSRRPGRRRQDDHGDAEAGTGSRDGWRSTIGCSRQYPR